jgi:antitoxin YefM
MARQATCTYVRENLARLLEEVEANRDVVIINRRGHEDVALVAAGELDSLIETAHLMRSPKNAERLLSALRGALARESNAQTVAELGKAWPQVRRSGSQFSKTSFATTSRGGSPPIREGIGIRSLPRKTGCS